MLIFCDQYGHCVVPSSSPANSPLPPALAPIIELTNIDMLRERYLVLEKALWLVIRSGADQTFALQRIHDTHITFFGESFNEHGIYLSAFDTDQIILFDAISHINVTVRALNDHYLHPNMRDFNQRESIGFSRLGVNVTEYIDRVFNVTDKDGGDFFRYIKRVLTDMHIGSKNFIIFFFAFFVYRKVNYKIVPIQLYKSNQQINNCLSIIMTYRQHY